MRGEKGGARNRRWPLAVIWLDWWRDSGGLGVLHYLDVMIGFAFTMLMLSLAVTAIVQAVPVYLRNLKGASLQDGLADLLARIADDADLQSGAAANYKLIVGRILRDPLLSPRRSPVVAGLLGLVSSPLLQGALQRSRAAVVHREEFVRLMLGFAGTDMPGEPHQLRSAREAARKAMGVPDAATAMNLLEQLRQKLAQLELDQPGWSASRRADQAMLAVLLNGPTQNFMAKLTGWYDQTIDRVDAAFTARVRFWTTLLSALLVLVLQLDSFDLLARLNADPVLREKVVSAAIESAQKLPAPAPAVTDAATPKAPAAVAETRAQACARDSLNDATSNALSRYADCMGLADATRVGLVEWPANFTDWKCQWYPRPCPFRPVAGSSRGVGAKKKPQHRMGPVPIDWNVASFRVMGMILSLGLLSLGAPFWYEALSNLIKLRSTIARKDDDARAERQTSQPGQTAQPAQASPPAQG